MIPPSLKKFRHRAFSTRPPCTRPPIRRFPLITAQIISNKSAFAFHISPLGDFVPYMLPARGGLAVARGSRDSRCCGAGAGQRRRPVLGLQRRALSSRRGRRRPAPGAAVRGILSIRSGLRLRTRHAPPPGLTTCIPIPLPVQSRASFPRPARMAVPRPASPRLAGGLLPAHTGT